VKDDFKLECYDPPTLVQCAHTAPPSPDEVRKPKWKRKEAREQAGRQAESAARPEPPRR
jgi:hypothetical protein